MSIVLLLQIHSSVFLFLLQTKFKETIIRIINVVKSIHSLRLQYSKQTTETSHGILGAVRAFKCGAYSSITSTKCLALGQRVCDDVTTVSSKKSRASDSAYVAAIALWQVPATVNAGFTAINVNNSCQSVTVTVNTMGSTATHLVLCNLYLYRQMMSLTLNVMMRNVRNFTEVHLEYGLYNTNFRKITWGTKYSFWWGHVACVCVRALARARACVVPY